MNKKTYSLYLLIIAVFFSAGTLLLKAQVDNPGFEEGYTGWQFTCMYFNGTDSVPTIVKENTPDGDNNKILMIPAGNTQGGCFISWAYQQFDAKDGEVWNLKAWAKKGEVGFGFAGPSIHFVRLPKDGEINAFQGAPLIGIDTTTSTEWVQLSITDTIKLEEGEKAGIVLNGGTTGGPGYGEGFFDNVTLEKIDITQDLSESNNTFFNNYALQYNPLSHELSLYSLTTNKNSEIQQLNIYDLKGSLYYTFPLLKNQDAVFKLNRLNRGIYFVEIREKSFSKTYKILVY